MKCIYCDKPVYGSAGITVPALGAAHQQCFQAEQALKRTFQHLEITALNDQELQDLEELIIAEKNSRSRSDDDDDSDIELF